MTTATESRQATGDYTLLDGERCYRIRNSERMPEFFMSLVGSGDHWMFVSSTGALTAGRRNADHALFPYAPDDQISAMRGTTGPITLVHCDDEVWEPFGLAVPEAPPCVRSLYKPALGNRLAFEEHHEGLQLLFRYDWTFSQRFGFVRRCRLENRALDTRRIELLDGLQNVLPSGIGHEFLMRFSNLGNAYKKSELVPRSDIGLFYLSSIPTDRPEPSEALESTVVWQTGLLPDATLLTTDAVAKFRERTPLGADRDVRGKPGAFLVNKTLTLAPGAAVEWSIVADVGQDHCDVVRLDDWLQNAFSPAAELTADIRNGARELRRIIASSDGLQCGANRHRADRHLSNTVFNVMRGGVPLRNYDVDSADFARTVARYNRETSREHRTALHELPASLPARDLLTVLRKREDPDLTRICLEYLPLAFSRRHGDPTRPWNRFSIDHRGEGGGIELHYEGNWRDIFQNWEALGFAFPELLTAMICRFANATTADGYNPYRITKYGFEWEEPVPGDPWANIGYWGDHQIVYLLKLLELSVRFDPRQLHELLDSPVFVHANVPYRIRGFRDTKQDPRNTIDFDTERAAEIHGRVARVGSDGALLRDRTGAIHRVTLLEKLLTLSLAKLANLVPDGGIWLNTQRPEWNDANNALVGNGVSVVTACDLHRWFELLHEQIAMDTAESYRLTEEVRDLFERILEVLRSHAGALGGRLDAAARHRIVEALSTAAAEYRDVLYTAGPSGRSTPVAREACLELFGTSRRFLAETIRANRRPDGLYHAYNLLRWTDDALEVEHLHEMLEGQVAVLGSGLLAPQEVAGLLDALRASALYRSDQASYLLYPDRQLPRFLEKNRIPAELAETNPLLKRLLAGNNGHIVRRDVRGGLHFHSDLRNAADLRRRLEQLGPVYASLVRDHGPLLVQTYEDIFGHQRFTGRSGTFFAYEGLGSIYWHMVSKLGRAVAENARAAAVASADPAVLARLEAHYRAIRAGIGAEKPPADYGAFPADPYSHTPENAGVKQPGMTGQVKEDVLTRFTELGVHIEDGCLGFSLQLFDCSERLHQAAELEYFDLTGRLKTVRVPRDSFGFTLFQVPVLYHPYEQDEIRVRFADGTGRTFAGPRLDRAVSRLLFARTGEVEQLDCRLRAVSE